MPDSSPVLPLLASLLSSWGPCSRWIVESWTASASERRRYEVFMSAVLSLLTSIPIVAVGAQETILQATVVKLSVSDPSFQIE